MSKFFGTDDEWRDGPESNHPADCAGLRLARPCPAWAAAGDGADLLGFDNEWEKWRGDPCFPGATPVASPRPGQRTFRWKVRRAVAGVCQARWQGGEGRPDDLPVADRQARTHRAQARGRVAGATVGAMPRLGAGQIQQGEEWGFPEACRQQMQAGTFFGGDGACGHAPCGLGPVRFA